MPEDISRDDLRNEYFKLADYVQQYDSHVLTIKAWGVGSSGAALGVGAAQADWRVLVVSLALSIAFWATEVNFKMLQLGHMRRLGELESQLQGAAELRRGPRIFGAFGEQSGANRARALWQSVLFWPQVMFPHAIFAGLSIAGLAIAAGRALGSR